MGKVIRKINLEEDINIVDFLKKIYSVNTDCMESELIDGNTLYKNIELDSILVNVTKEENEIIISKLVSLKAFLLSKEQGMNINDLLANIDKVMKMSNGLNKGDSYIDLDSELKKFLATANMEVVSKNEDKVTLSDGKRFAIVNVKDGKIDFNSISEVEK